LRSDLGVRRHDAAFRLWKATTFKPFRLQQARGGFKTRDTNPKCQRGSGLLRPIDPSLALRVGIETTSTSESKRLEKESGVVPPHSKVTTP
jgi:hypothetical protein